MNWKAFNLAIRCVTLTMVFLGLLYMMTPILVILPLSLSPERFLAISFDGISMQWYQALWDKPGYLRALGNTLLIGAGVSILATVLGAIAALAVVRGKLPYGRVVTGVILSPLIMPQVILAIGIFPILAFFGLIGSGSAVVVAHAAIAIPLSFITVSAALRGYSENLELASMTLGANGLATFIHVTVPMIRLAMVIGAIFAFAFSFDEIIIALFLTDASSITLPVFMWNELRSQMDPTIAAASTVAIVISLSMLSAAALLQSADKSKS
ncbi:ABC transporter permease [Agrobacterium sp. LAD9]|uniref:ABC transporter permease n=1 Tax=Agrobacterium sp. LAD9 TaxID=2055153 RepID=UPI000D1E2771|nr:ABC transporter permease [Agrobacterium sp. LAD9]